MRCNDALYDRAYELHHRLMMCVYKSSSGSFAGLAVLLSQASRCTPQQWCTSSSWAKPSAASMRARAGGSTTTSGSSSWAILAPTSRMETGAVRLSSQLACLNVLMVDVLLHHGVSCHITHNEHSGVDNVLPHYAGGSRRSGSC